MAEDEFLNLKDAYCDLSQLSNIQLDTYFKKLSHTRVSVAFAQDTNFRGYQAEEYPALLNAAISEKYNRATSRLTKIAITIAAASTLSALANVYFAFGGGLK